MSNEVKIVVDAKDTTANAIVTAQSRVRTFKAETLRALDDINAKKAKVDLDIVKATQNLDKLKQLADGATGDKKTRYDAEIAAAEAKLKVLENKSDDLRKTIKLKAEVDEKSFSAGDFIGKAGSALKVGLVGAAGVAAVGMTPVIGGAIVAGGMLGVVGLAASLHKDNPALKAAGKGLADTVKDGMRQASAGLVDPMIDALEIFRRQFAADLPMIGGLFDAVGDSVRPFAQGLAEAAHNALPGIVAGLRGAQPFLTALAQELPGLGEAIGDTFATMGKVAPAAIDSMRMLFGTIDLVLGAFRGLVVAGAWVSEAMKGNFLSLDELKEMYSGMPPVIDGTASSMGGLAGQGDAAAKSLRDAANAMLAARGDARGFEAAIDAATDALKENGKTLDITTDAGRANQEALDGIAAAGLRMRDSAAEAGESQATLNGILQSSRSELVKTAVRFGMTRRDAEAYANKVLGIPRVAGTQAYFDDGYARVRIAAFRRSLLALNNVTVNPGPWKGGYTFPGQYTGGISHAAEGGPRGNLTMVGEYGRELVRLPFGAQVMSNPDTERMLSAGGSGGRYQFEAEWVGGNATDEFMSFLRKNIRIRGGLTAALGAA